MGKYALPQLRLPEGWPVVLCTLLAFGRLVYRLGAKELWLDEALALQRASGSWPGLLSGHMPIEGSAGAAPMLSTHPAGYFVLTRLMLALTGDSEFSLRLLSVIAATLLVPAAWAFARRLAPARPGAARHPGLGRRLHRRLAVLPLVRARSAHVRPGGFAGPAQHLRPAPLGRPSRRPRAKRYVAGYIAATGLLLTLHYYGVLILPAHALIVYLHLARSGRRQALLEAGGVMCLAILPTLSALQDLLGQPAAVDHFSAVSLSTMLPDLLNAFSLGISADPEHLWWLDLVFAGLALLGALVIVGRELAGRRTHPGQGEGAMPGWLLLAWLAGPVLLLAGINAWRAAYTTARELSLVSAAFVLLFSVGVAWLWERRRLAGALIGVGLLVGMGYSSYDYFTQPQYEKGDLSSMGADLRQQILPGDLVLVEPASWWQLFHYYLPLEALEAGGVAGRGTGWQGVVSDTLQAARETELAGLARGYHRIWLARSEPDSAAAAWLEGHTSRISRTIYASPLSLLELELYVPDWPVSEGVPAGVQHTLNVTFGDQVRLVGYASSRPLIKGAPIPVTLYWQADRPMARRYKYRIDLLDALTGEQVAVTDQQYDAGRQPTTGWQPGQTIVAYSGIRPPQRVAPLDWAGRPPGPTPGGGYEIRVVVYDEETLDRLPAVLVQGNAEGAQIGDDGLSVTLPLPVPPSAEASGKDLDLAGSRGRGG